MDVVFAPLSTGALDATLDVISNDPANPNEQVSLTGTGTQALLMVVPTSLDLGSVAVGSSNDGSIDLESVGAAPLAVLDLSTIGSAFSVVSAPATPFAIPGGGSETLTVRCAPATTGPKSGSLVVDSDADNGSPTIVSLSCNGTMAPLSVPLLTTFWSAILAMALAGVAAILPPRTGSR